VSGLVEGEGDVIESLVTQVRAEYISNIYVANGSRRWKYIYFQDKRRIGLESWQISNSILLKI
jgi:hypothetical protein